MELDYMLGIRLIDAVRTTTVQHARLLRLLLLEEWRSPKGRPSARAGIDLFQRLDPSGSASGGAVSRWMSLLLGDGKGGLLKETASKDVAKAIFKARFRLLHFFFFKKYDPKGQQLGKDR